MLYIAIKDDILANIVFFIQLKTQSISTKARYFQYYLTALNIADRIDLKLKPLISTSKELSYFKL